MAWDVALEDGLSCSILHTFLAIPAMACFANGILYVQVKHPACKFQEAGLLDVCHFGLKGNLLILGVKRLLSHWSADYKFEPGFEKQVI